MKNLLLIITFALVFPIASAQNIWNFSTSPGVFTAGAGAINVATEGPLFYSDGIEPDTLTASSYTTNFIESSFSAYPSLFWIFRHTTGKQKMGWELNSTSGYIEALGYDRVINIPNCKSGEIISIEYSSNSLTEPLYATEFISPKSLSSSVSLAYSSNLKFTTIDSSVVSQNSSHKVIADYSVVSDADVNIFSSSNGYKIYRISKGGSLVSIFKVSNTLVKMPKEVGAEEKVYISTQNIPYWTTSSSQSWLNVSPLFAASSDSVSFTTNEENTTGISREAIVSLISSIGDTLQVSVMQSSESRTIILSKDSLSLEAEINSSDTISLSSNMSWTASSDQSWLKVSPESGLIDTTLTFTAISANLADTARVATITFAGNGGVSKTIYIVQDKLPKQLIVSSDTARIAAYANSKDTLSVSSNVSWVVSSDQSWLTAVRSSIDTTQLILTAEVNKTGAKRTAKIAIVGELMDTVFVIVVQESKFVTATVLNSILAKEALSLASIQVEASVSWTATSSESWLILNNTSAIGNLSITCTAEENTTFASRAATVTLSSDGLPDQVLGITQMPAVYWNFSDFPTTTFMKDTVINHLFIAASNYNVNTKSGLPSVEISKQIFTGRFETLGAGFNSTGSTMMPIKRFLKFETKAASTVTVWFQAYTTERSCVISDGINAYTMTDNGTGKMFTQTFDKASTIYIYGDAGIYIQGISATNIRTQKVPDLLWNTPSSIYNGVALASTQLNASSSISGSFVYTPSVGTKLSSGNHQLAVKFTPTDTVTYETVFDTVSILVKKFVPNVTWNPATDIDCETTLNQSILNATANVPGKFIYTPDTGVVLNAGANKLYVEFIPADTALFETVIDSVTIDVKKLLPQVVWSTPDSLDISYGGLIDVSSFGLGDINGTVCLKDSSLVLSAGNQKLVIVFVPTDFAKYATVFDTIDVLVAKVLPTLSWTNPADIELGTVLSETQLDATANLPGKFTYSPDLGAELNIGDNQLLITSFVPSDTVNYETVKDTVYINVRSASTDIIATNRNKITVYPNPVKDVLSIAGVDGRASAVISNLQGKVLLNEEFINQTQLNVQALTSGTYIISISSDACSYKAKIIKE